MAISAGSTILQSDLMVPFTVTLPSNAHFATRSAQGYSIGDVCFINFSFSLTSAGVDALQSGGSTTFGTTPYSSLTNSACAIGIGGRAQTLVGRISSNSTNLTITGQYYGYRQLMSYTYTGQIIYLTALHSGTVPTANSLVKATDFKGISTFTANPSPNPWTSGSCTGWRCGNLVVVNFDTCVRRSSVLTENAVLATIPWTTIASYQGVATLIPHNSLYVTDLPYITILPNSSSIKNGSINIRPDYAFSGQIITFV